MKNEKEEAKEYFERNILLVIAVIAGGLFLDWLSIHLLANVNPWGSLIAVPGVVLTLQGLWLIVNPYAIVYENRFEIKHSLFYHKEIYFLDLKTIISKNNSKSLSVVYNDNEISPLVLFGMRNSHKELFYKNIQEKINLSIQQR